jgi:chromatin structure-remodeling complex subunit RSC1/2
LPEDKAVYVCESRYNEEKHRFNKIKTWNSCLPDEVRDKDYEMTLFPVARQQKKFPSPIKHLLQADARETDELPKPTWRGANAPPLIGAVHRRPREKNESPPPEAPRAHPPNIPVGLAMGASPRPPVGTPGMPGQYHHAAPVAPLPIASPSHFQQFQVAPRQGPPATPHGMGQVHIQPQPQGMPGMHVQQHTGMSQMPMMPMQQQMQPQMQPTPQFPPHPAYNAHAQYVPQPQAPHQAHYQNPAHLAPAYDPHLRQIHPSPVATNSRPPMAPTPAHPLGSAPMPHPAASSPNMYNPPRAPEVYTLADDADNAIPKHVKEQFKCDDNGRLLWFTSPPIFNQGRSSEVVALSDTVSHIKDIKDIRAERRAKRQSRDEAVAAERLREAEQAANAKRAENADKIALLKQRLSLNSAAARELQAQQEINALINDPVALEKFARAFKEHMDEGTKFIFKEAGYDWEPTPWPES